jgi:hypothetical protein
MNTLQLSDSGAVMEENAPMFKVIKDGHGFELKVANLDNPTWCPNTGIVKIEATKISSRNNKNVIIKTVNDKQTGAIFGIDIGVDRVTKDIIWERINLKEFEFFDLSNRKERARYIVLSRHYTMEGSPNQFGKPNWRVIDQQRKASTYLEERGERKRAAEVAENLTYEQMVDLAPAFGIRPEAHSQTMLTAEIYKIADTDHKKFLTIWDNPDKQGMVVFKRALKNGLISFDQTYGYTYEGQVLGKTEPQAFSYLTRNIQLLSAIDMLSKEKETNSSHSYSPVVPKQVNPMEELKKQLEAKEKELEELKKKVVITNTTVNTVTAETNPEKEELVKEAKNLGIKGSHLFGLQKLKDEIEKAKKEQETK